MIDEKVIPVCLVKVLETMAMSGPDSTLDDIDGHFVRSEPYDWAFLLKRLVGCVEFSAAVPPPMHP